MIVSITRLRLRSIRFLPAFLYHSNRSLRQARQAPGCLHAEVRKTQGLAFWTLTFWENEQQLKQYVGSGAHRAAMPKLVHWCDQAVVTHWDHGASTPPTWDEAAARLAKQGRPSRLAHPSESQRNGVIEIN